MLSPFHSLTLKFSNLSFFSFSFFLVKMFPSFLFKLKNNFFMMNIFLLSLMNLAAMIPFFWSFTSYFWSNFLVSFSFWLLFMFMMTLKNFNYFLAQFLPNSCPNFLWLFLVFLEITSQLMRPLTLSLRLACNLMTGHVLIFLLLSDIKILFLILIFILMFEMSISFIQASVFSLLMCMYLEESKGDKV